MNRIILFKGKRVDNGELIKGSLIISTVAHQEHFHIQQKESAGQRYVFEVHPETVCQSFDCGSGSFYEDDKVIYNGKEYIVKFHLSFATLERTLFEHGENESVFINEDVAYLMKIIGNIHD